MPLAIVVLAVPRGSRRVESRQRGSGRREANCPPVAAEPICSRATLVWPDLNDGLVLLGLVVLVTLGEENEAVTGGVVVQWRTQQRLMNRERPRCRCTPVPYSSLSYLSSHRTIQAGIAADFASIA
jgi:hypothetical protein